MKKINSIWNSCNQILKLFRKHRIQIITMTAVVIIMVITYVFDAEHSSVVAQGKPNVLTATNYKGGVAFICNGFFVDQGIIVNREKIKVLIDSKEYCANPGKMNIVFKNNDSSRPLNGIISQEKRLYFNTNLSADNYLSADTIEIKNHGGEESFLHKMITGTDEDIVEIKMYNPFFNSLFQVQNNDKLKLMGDFTIIIDDDVLKPHNSEIEIANPNMSASFYIEQMKDATILLQNSAEISLNGTISDLNIEMIPGNDRLVINRPSNQMEYAVGAQTVIINNRDSDLIFKYDSNASIPLNVTGRYRKVEIDNIDISYGIGSFLITHTNEIIMTILSVFLTIIIERAVEGKSMTKSS